MEWLNANEGNGEELEIPYFSFTEENIAREENRRQLGEKQKDDQKAESSICGCGSSACAGDYFVLHFWGEKSTQGRCAPGGSD